jgi:hypothetical protein
MKPQLAILLVATLLASGCFDPKPADLIVPSALTYLVGAQNPDGGFGSAPGTASDFSTSAWVALAIAAGDPASATIPPLRSYLAAASRDVRENTTGSFSRLNAVSLYVLASQAIGLPGAEEHLERLVREADNTTVAVNEQIFLLGALARGARVDATPALTERIRLKILDPRDPDLIDDAWMRSYAVLALLAAGQSKDDPDMRAAARSLLGFQKDEKGFRGTLEYEPDASTTAAVAAVLAQVRFVYGHERDAGLEFIRELQSDAGDVRFSKEFGFAPVKTTAEAILGATGKGPFR